jgi:UDP-N-acetylmuramate--alanine ligase
VKDLTTISNIYFLGIGGIGMSALARYFSQTGKNVAGYDRTPTPLTRQLSAEGILIHYDDSVDLIPQDFNDPHKTLVILTPAIPRDHSEYNYLKDNGFEIIKRSQMLGLITSGHKTVAVAGTHGKTTVSTMIAWIMSNSKAGCSAFLGGISKNFNGNLVTRENSEWMVTEADEFDRSFLQLHPYAGVITAMDPDHLDIYGNAESMFEAFNSYAGQIDRNGILLMKEGLPLDEKVRPAHTYTYSLSGAGDFHAINIRLENRRYTFDLKGPFASIQDISLEHPGVVNVENAVAASAVCTLLGVDDNTIRESLARFSGILRRFDYQIKTEDLVYIDDYAHHPREIEATLVSVRKLYPDKKITGIFQPHLYTRTRDFAEGFARSLSLLDRLILLDIYPARELPIEGVQSEMIFRDVTIKNKVLCKKEDVLSLLEKSQIEVLITLGAGDIDKLVVPIRQLLLKRINA